MKINCLKEDLQKAVYQTEKITGKNLSLPVLKGILITVDNYIILNSTNLDLGIEIIVPGKIENKGRVVVDGSILNNFLSNISKNELLTIELKNNNLFISGKSIKTNLTTLSDDDFPVIPKPKTKNSFKIKKDILINGLKSVWFSASNSNIKPELSSVYIYQDGEKIIFVATDSFRLAEKKVLAKDIPEFESILLPIKNVPDIIRFIEESNEDINVFIEESQISFSYKNHFLTSRIINGSFPDYKQIIPKEFETEILSLKEDALNHLKLTNVFADKFNQIVFSSYPSKKTFTIKSHNQEKGDNLSFIDAVLKGKDIEIGFNYRYIMDSFQSITGDSVSFLLAGQGRPMLIKSVPDNGFTYVVMPMNR
jgi:DNA polymerase III subunit beta